MYNRKVICNLDLNDIRNMMEEQFGCKADSMDFKDMKMIYDVYMELQDEINKYRDERVSIWSSKNKDKYKVIFHAIPFDAFLISQIDFRKAKTILNKKFLHSFFFSDFESLCSDKKIYGGKLFRNGIFEIILEEYRDEGGVNVRNPHREFKTFINESLDAYRELGISCPIVYFVTFTNIKGKNMIVSDIDHTDIEKDILDPSGVVIKDKKQVDVAWHNIFVPIWNHFKEDVDYIFDESIEE